LNAAGMDSSTISAEKLLREFKLHSFERSAG